LKLRYEQYTSRTWVQGIRRMHSGNLSDAFDPGRPVFDPCDASDALEPITATI